MDSPAEPTLSSGTLKPDLGQRFARLVEIMARLRSPDGCPWDREQNFDTIKPYLLEETYEVMNAIDARDFEGLAEELGDLLLQAVFFAQMASEEGHFNIGDSVDAINNKLIRRHPHVFGDAVAKTSRDVKKRWDEIKAEERARAALAESGNSPGPDATGSVVPQVSSKKPRPRALLEGVPRSLPALVEAQQIASRAAGTGFDWDNLEQVLDKLREELAELDAARAHPEVEDEVGDVLFVLVNVARFLKVDPEQALRKTNAKFRRRFAHIEDGLSASGKTLLEASMDEMENLWQEAKRAESRR